MMIRSLALLLIALNFGYSSATTTLPAQHDFLFKQLDAAIVPLAFEHELEDLQHDFATLTHLCFDPIVLDCAGADELNQQKVQWNLLARKASARANAIPTAAYQILHIMQRAIEALQHAFLHTQLLTLGKQQSTYAVLNKGLDVKEQQEVMLTIIKVLLSASSAEIAQHTTTQDPAATLPCSTLDINSDAYKALMVKAFSKTCKDRFELKELFSGVYAGPSGIEFGVMPPITLAGLYMVNALQTHLFGKMSNINNTLIMGATAGILAITLTRHYTTAATKKLWNALRTRWSELPKASKLIATNALNKQQDIVKMWLNCLMTYQSYTTGKATEPEQTKPNTTTPLAALLTMLDEGTITISNRLDAATDLSTQTMLRYIISHINTMRLSLQTASVGASFSSPVLKEAFAKHCAIMQSESFINIKNRHPELANSYHRLVELFFVHKTGNHDFAHQTLTTIQSLNLNISTMKQNWYLAKLGRPENPAVEVMMQMVSVLETCNAWQNKQSFSILEQINRLVPPALKNHPIYQQLVMNSNLLAPAGLIASLPIVNKIISWIHGPSKPTETSDAYIKSLLLLEKEHPAIFEIVQQDPEVRERLVKHFAAAIPTPMTPTPNEPAPVSTPPAQPTGIVALTTENTTPLFIAP